MSPFGINRAITLITGATGRARQVGVIPSLVIEDSGQILAYANQCLGVDDSGTDPFLAQGYPNLWEVGLAPARPDLLLVLSRFTLNKVIQQKMSKLTVHLPPHHHWQLR